jgi:hypothetical protein
MIGNASSYGWGTRHPTSPIGWQMNGHAQAMMISAEVVDRANQIHGLMQGRRLTSQGTTSAHQGRKPCTESRVQSFDIGDFYEGVKSTKGAGLQKMR